MRMHFILIFLLAITLLSGCVTKYGKFDTYGGYRDIRLSTNKYEIEFTSTRVMTKDRLKKMLLYRCAEVTLAAKADYFEIISERDTISYNWLHKRYTIVIYSGIPKELPEGAYVAKKVIEDYRDIVMN